jgi:hypothetical protein
VIFESTSRVLKDVNALVATATPVIGGTALWRACAPETKANRSALARHPKSGPDRRYELPES